MQILVIAATEMEIAFFKEAGLPVDILITGVGAPAAMYKLLDHLHDNKYDLVIQAGIGGMFSGANLQLCETVIIKKDVFADLGIEEKKSFSTLFELGFAIADDPPYTNGWLVNNYEFIEKFPLKKVTAVTVNKVSDDIFQTETFLKKYQPAVESMEGAAFHFVCLQQNVAFLQLRSISNEVGERDKTKWQLRSAIHRLNETLKQLITGLQETY